VGLLSPPSFSPFFFVSPFPLPPLRSATVAKWPETGALAPFLLPSSVPLSGRWAGTEGPGKTRSLPASLSFSFFFPPPVPPLRHCRPVTAVGAPCSSLLTPTGGSGGTMETATVPPSPPLFPLSSSFPSCAAFGPPEKTGQKGPFFLFFLLFSSSTDDLPAVRRCGRPPVLPLFSFSPVVVKKMSPPPFLPSLFRPLSAVPTEPECRPFPPLPCLQFAEGWWPILSLLLFFS